MKWCHEVRCHDLTWFVYVYMCVYIHSCVMYVYVYFCVTRQHILSLALSSTVSSFCLKKYFLNFHLFPEYFFYILKCIIHFLKGSVLCDHQANVPKSCDSLFGFSLAISNVWKTWKLRKRVKKEENGTGSLTAHRCSIDSPHIILSFPSHHWGLKPDCRRSWGSALTCVSVCVCVCVLQTGSPRFHPPIRSSCGADPQHGCASSESSDVSTKTDQLIDGKFPQYTWFLTVLHGHRL